MIYVTPPKELEKMSERDAGRHLTEGYIEAGAVTLHYLRSGGAKPPIVLSHGFSDNGRCWASLIPVLASDYDVIAYDARAHGQSSAPSGAYSIADQATDLISLIERLELERPILMGHSMGGLATFWAAIDRPNLPRATIFEDSALPGRTPPRQRDADGARSARTGMNDWVASLQSRSVTQLIELCRENSPNWPEVDYAPWAESKLQLDLASVERFSIFGERDLAEFLPALAPPALFLMADAPEEERARQREIVSRVPNGRVVNVEGAGHNVRRDEHERTTEILRRFLVTV